jgi:hypothetical protein
VIYIGRLSLKLQVERTYRRPQPTGFVTPLGKLTGISVRLARWLPWLVVQVDDQFQRDFSSCCDVGRAQAAKTNSLS